jgi:4-amino-4-deoxy-L-arabinose transferase-like glycosyltransferase
MISEPMTVLTDYALAGVTAWLSWLLYRARGGRRARSYWTLAFAALALGALFGGTWHGFAPVFPEIAVVLLWKATVLSIGVASFGMLAGSATATVSPGAANAFAWIATAKLALYSGWTFFRSEYIWVIADTGLALAAVAALHAWSAIRRRDRASLWILGGVGVSVLAAAVQAGGFAPHPYFNHNDLYHVIQIGAMLLLHAGARRLDTGDPSWLAVTRS